MSTIKPIVVNFSLNISPLVWVASLIAFLEAAFQRFPLLLRSVLHRHLNTTAIYCCKAIPDKITRSLKVKKIMYNYKL